MKTATQTDRHRSFGSAEFEWDIDSPTEANGFVLPALREFLGGAQRLTLLDLGCGNGTIAGALAACGHSVVGLDHSRSGIAIARKRFPELRFERHDLAAPLPAEHAGRYDCVVSSEVIEHLLLPRCLMAAARAALRPGGLFILTTPFHGYWKNLALAVAGRFDAHWHPLRDYGHVKFFSRSTVLLLLGEFGFEDLRFRTVGRIPPLARSMVVAGRKPG